MNKPDKTIYRMLKFFSEITINKLLKLKENKPKEYKRIIPKDLEEDFIEMRYISFLTDKDRMRHNSALTPKGLEQLRVLEDIKLKEQSIWISIWALIISFGALIISVIALTK